MLSGSGKRRLDGVARQAALQARYIAVERNVESRAGKKSRLGGAKFWHLGSEGVLS